MWLNKVLVDDDLVHMCDITICYEVEGPYLEAFLDR